MISAELIVVLRSVPACDYCRTNRPIGRKAIEDAEDCDGCAAKLIAAMGEKAGGIAEGWDTGRAAAEKIRAAFGGGEEKVGE